MEDDGEKAREFARDLERRRKAQDGLEKDLLTDVPMLYGSPGEYFGWNMPKSYGDPGVILAQIHREEMLKRNDVREFKASGKRSEVRLPFERTMIALALIWLIYCFVR